MQRYNPKDIERRWQKVWADTKIYEAIDFDPKPKYVMLTEFPYPSGAGIHIGHSREYTLGDVMGRHKRMQGYNVLYPMGYDAFGLPTENYAIKNKISPQQATDENVANFQKQLESLGFGIDWSRSFRTSDPNYYRWTQWLFLQFYKAGLAYQDEIAINWCPFCKTGLANEEVVNGRHERCDTPVEKKLLKQWLLKITEYADRLIDGLEDVDYPSRIADQQINWIGRSKGAEIDFVIEGQQDKLRVFTTRPDTIFGATFMVLAPEHPLVEQITTVEHKGRIETYVKAAQAKSDIERQDESREKTGAFTGAYATNPATGEKIPIWIADYVLSGYGTGAIMAVPAHDERDHEFARKFDLQIKPVIEPKFIATSGSSAVHDGEEFVKREAVCAVVRNPKTDEYLCVSWKTHPMNGLVTGGVEPGEDPVEAARREVHEETGYKNVRLVKDPGTYIHSLFYHRQKQQNRWARFHYIFFELENDERDPVQASEAALLDAVWKSKAELEDYFTVVEGQYIVGLLDNPDAQYAGEGIMANSGPYDGMPSAEARDKIVADLAAKGVATEKINYRLRDWIFSRQHYWGEPIPIIHCPEHGAVAVPDEQLPVTLPPVDHYEPTDTGESPLAAISDWVNTTCPTCGKPAKRETDTMPNWAGSSWYYLRYFDAHNDQVFADRQKLDYWGMVDLYLGGMEHTTLHLLYSRFWHEFFYDQGLVPTPEPYKARRGQGIILAADGSKMSKSKGNVVNPTEVIDSGYGADALRVAIAFIAPYDQTTPWSPEGVAGTYRFLNRVWILTQEFLETTNSEPQSTAAGVLPVIHRTIKKVSEDLEAMNFNTAIAAQMEAVNELYRLKSQDHFANQTDWRFALESLLQLLAPFAPHLTEELWQQLGHEDSIHLSKWPTYDEKYLASDSMTIVVQINGKLRAQLALPADASQAQVIETAKAEVKVQAYIADKEIKKEIYVPGKLVNFVIAA